MPAGRLDRYVALQARTETTDSEGFTQETYVTQVSVWAQRIFLRGAERFAAQQVVAEVDVTFRIRHRTDLDPTWRLKDGSDLWDIEAVLPGEKRGRYIDLLCSRHDPTDTED